MGIVGRLFFFFWKGEEDQEGEGGRWLILCEGWWDRTGMICTPFFGERVVECIHLSMPSTY